MVLFMGAMMGLAAAQDLVLLFLFFDLTAVASYFLIAFDRERPEARSAALMALLVTAGTAVVLLVGIIVLLGHYGTASIPALIAIARPDDVTIAAVALVALAALAKSAQVPFHFWLPRAMAAPTPVSAYLHSAAMVAAGVLVIARVHPLLSLDARVLDGLYLTGVASIVVGGILSLASDGLKQILAYSTISQYGYVVALYGIGGSAAAGAAALYVVAHALAKSALFMTAGTVTEATGASRLSGLGGLARPMPLLAITSGVAAASLAALPLTLGFFKDELFFSASAGAGPVAQGVAVLAAGLTLAYIGRFWMGLFLGPLRVAPARVPALLVAPIAFLAVVTVLGGLVVDPIAWLAEQAASVSQQGPVEVHPAYHLDVGTENLMAVAAWIIGGAILVIGPARLWIPGALAHAGERMGPRHWYSVAIVSAERLSDAVHRAEVRDLRMSLIAVLIPTGVLTALGFMAPASEIDYDVGALHLGDAPIVVLLVLAVVAALTTARDKGRLRPALALSVLGFALAAVYAVVGAPDVALVAVLVETVLTLIFVAVFSRLPPTMLRSEPPERPARAQRIVIRDVVAGVIAGLSAFAVIWAALSRPPLAGSDAAEQIRLTPAAHGGDVVTVILADFRGLDTMVEITVLAVAITGAAVLLRRRALR
jgi:multicomponent Na+:H+ antiporter subunit A